MQGLFCFAKMTISARERRNFYTIFIHGNAMAGRPRKDDINTQQLIINLARTGMTNTAIAEVTGLSRLTVQNWLSGTELGDTVRAVREASSLLEASQKHALNRSAIAAAKKLLRKRKVEETEERYDSGGNLLYRQTRTREAEPNAGIVQFVLKCTDPQNWNEQQVVERQNAGAAENDSELKIEIVDGGDDN